jgi:hypothetical protein
MKRWTIAAGESPRVYLINDGRDAVGEIVYTDTRRPEDARLIAAAPDLLDALRDLLDACPETYDNRHERTAAEDAIAKAEGARS